MEKPNLLNKVLATAGTLFAWFPIAAPILTSVPASIRRGFLRFDYLMPAELFLFALVGGCLLLWAAFRIGSRRALIGGGLGIAVAFLVGGQALAVVTGLASGEVEPTGWPWVLVVGSLAVYSLAVLAVAVGGALLLRDVFGRSPAAAGGS